ncbi:MAG: sorbosone dehydrogenase family protein [Pyrinomonadaceae bacterium]|nr:sorbosone dehydrogenase family protein [Pyrinomonadaceae bacterium]
MNKYTNTFRLTGLILFLGVGCFAQSVLPKVVETEAPKVHAIDPKKLPPPFASESARRPSRFVDQPENAELTVPKGFSVSLFADTEMFDDRSYPRLMAEAPNGDVFVSDSRLNRILVFRDEDGDGKADKRHVFTTDTVQPFGLEFAPGKLYVANTDSVVWFEYRSGMTKAIGKPKKIIDLPGRGYRQHWTRNIAISPDGKKIYVTVGSETNVSVEEDPRRAAVSVYDIDGRNHRIFASGIRNPVGLDFNPISGELWTAVNERDRIGDDLVPDYVTSVKDGGFYGWPYSYIGKNPDPRRKDDMRGDLVKKSIIPDVLVRSHSAALGIKFYAGDMFPDQYEGDAFVAFHGSWNRSKLTGYKIIRIRFDEKGKAEGNRYEDFVTGWLPDENSREVWGRPVGLLVASDGALLITDDNGKRIWRVTYKGK